MLQSLKRFLKWARRFLCNSRGLYGSLDSPATKNLHPGSLNSFSGWIFDQNGETITGVEIFQGAKKLGLCNYGLTREDVYTAYPDYPQAKTCGFSGWVPLQQTSGSTICVYILFKNRPRYLLARRQLPRRIRTALFFKKFLQQKENVRRQPYNKTCSSSDIPRRILIAGMAKTGTTGLFFKIGNSLVAYGRIASETKFLFEPTSYSDTTNDRVLAKILIQKETARPVAIDDFKSFSRKILLVRDPRDRIISALLYTALGRSFRSIRGKIENFLSLLEKKEHNPGSVSILALNAELLRARNISLQAWKNRLAGNLDYFLHFQRNQTDFFCYRYEAFVQNQTEELETFLGFPLVGEATVGKTLRHVARSKKSGDWQNWFTEEDICFFKPLFHEFIHSFGYEDSWALPDRQVILPAHASEYIRKNVCL